MRCMKSTGEWVESKDATTQGRHHAQTYQMAIELKKCQGNSDPSRKKDLYQVVQFVADPVPALIHDSIWQKVSQSRIGII